MISPIDLATVALLPLVAVSVSASRTDRLDRRGSAAVAQLAERKYNYAGAHSIEARMARRAVGRQLAVSAHKADPSACRRRNTNYLAYFSASGAVASSTSAVSGTASVSSVTRSGSIGASSTQTAAATSTSTAAAGAVNSPAAEQAPSPSPAPSPKATQAASPPPPSSGGNTGFTPNGIKAGMSAGDSYDWVKDHIGWWYDWTPNPSGHSGSPVAVPMIWGAGTADGTDHARLQEFKGISHTPPYIIGFEEPDCAAGSGSAGFDVATGVALWNSVVAPKGAAGSLLVSPSMCHQAAEQGWLGPFQSQISRDWDITNVHINKVDAAGIRSVLDHYWNTYGKPIWVTEFACVDDVHGFTPCINQAQIDEYIRTAVGIFESDSRVAAYAYSNGYGLGDVWPAMKNGQLSASGQTYLAAISQYH